MSSFSFFIFFVRSWSSKYTIMPCWTLWLFFPFKINFEVSFQNSVSFRTEFSFLSLLFFETFVFLSFLLFTLFLLMTLSLSSFVSVFVLTSSSSPSDSVSSGISPFPPDPEYSKLLGSVYSIPSP